VINTIGPWGKVVLEHVEEKEDISFTKINSRIIEMVRKEVPLERRRLPASYLYLNKSQIAI